MPEPDRQPVPSDGAERLPLRLTIVFGLVVIVAFGSWFYGFGVLVEPIGTDTGWAESALSTAYGLGLFGVGIGAVLAGRIIDRFGPRAVFAGCAVGVFVGTVVIVTAESPTVFTVAAVGTQCFVGAAGYYTAVHASIARLVPGDRTRAITVNTLWGAFASPVFLPLMAWLALTWGWRGALVVSGTLVALIFVLAAVMVSGHTAPVQHTESPGFFAGLAWAGRNRATRHLLAVGLCGGVVSSVLFLYQVPAMVSAGLALGVASALAGLRGLFQLLGRLPLPWLVRRIGARTVFRVSLAAVGLSSLLLLVSGNLALAITFAVVAGAAVGAYSTLESIYTAEIVPVHVIGMILGVYSMIRGIGSAIGPTGAGFLTDATGTRAAALAVIAVIAVVGALLVPAKPAEAEQPATTVAT